MSRSSLPPFGQWTDATNCVRRETGSRSPLKGETSGEEQPSEVSPACGRGVPSLLLVTLHVGYVPA